MSPRLVRLAVGTEGIDDILADLRAGFTATQQPDSQIPVNRHMLAT